MGTKNKPGKFDCYDDIDPNEPFFVLRANDPMAADIVRIWALRYYQSKGYDMDKYIEAKRCATAMDDWRAKREG